MPPLAELYRSSLTVCAGGSGLTSLTLEPRDAMRSRVFIAPFAVYVTVEAAQLASVQLDIAAKEIELSLLPHPHQLGMPDADASGSSRRRNGAEAVVTVRRTAEGGNSGGVSNEVVLMCGALHGLECLPASRRGGGQSKAERAYRVPLHVPLAARDDVEVTPVLIKMPEPAASPAA